MAAISPYLMFDGTCEAAFAFYKSVFGGEFEDMKRYKDMSTPEMQAESGRAMDRIMHVALPIGPHSVLMGCDTHPKMGTPVKGDDFNIALMPSSEAEASHLFHKLAEGGRVNMPLDKAPWGAYFGMLTDKFGIEWMVNYVSKT